MSQKTCFVTVGATASFTALIRAVLEADFLTALQNNGYTELLVQYGEGGKQLFDTHSKTAINAAKDEGNEIKISGFDLDKAGLGRYMRQAKGANLGAGEGVVISHAGSGTILDALRISVPLIVVPNADLLDNHQVELAEVLAEQDYVVYGKLESLDKALGEAEVWRKKQRQWPPTNSGVHRHANGLKGVMDEEMGFLD
ncbi:glycosyltransferase family 1 protein [Baudoinia panamericana UAMH 10762]|uniref:UDP-N-acetylglucosamine transferase subunit ALG13 n=1 Tax=Baudoinia panamericana (strain UAMH 10762) TaxID=717646 RepID=M2N1C4_BAUPA|nr:glycosyltransferase family 1 protein [Baudoinia panamericana UAMH 10762]EMC92435.1 glycosyltransferase family 1 protein [Baudoinia panamericana UAMH 10762]